MTRRFLDRGFYVNCAAFPAVPVGRAGLRFNVTRHHREEDIERLIATIAD